MNDYLAQKPEFQHVQGIDLYYKDYDGHEDEEVVIEFWNQVIYEYSYFVTSEFQLNAKNLVKQFTIFDRVPCGLPSILCVLHARGKIATKEQIQSGSFYQKQNKQSLIGWVASGLYNSTIGSFWSSSQKIPENPPQKADYICIDYLDRQADQLLKWAAKQEKHIHSEANLKRQLRKATEHSEQDIELLLLHMKHSGRLILEKIGTLDDSELLMCKLATPTSKIAELPTQKEKAEFALKINIKRLDEKITDYVERIHKCTFEIKTALAQGSKQVAVLMLRRRKSFEKQLQVLEGQKFTIEEQLLNLESAESTASVFETMSIASSVNKALLKEGLQDGYQFENLLQEMNEQKDDVASLTQQFSELATGDEDLLKELDDMANQEQEPQKVNIDEQEQKDRELLDAKLAKWEMELKDQGYDIGSKVAPQKQQAKLV